MPKEKGSIRAPAEEKNVQEIPVGKIDPFPNHPFRVEDDRDMEELMESIAARGLITPVLVRKHGKDCYEMISGHRRLHACKRLGIAKILAEVTEMSREEATIVMVESNFQRPKILPSEKAAAYKMRLEAMKRQGTRTDLTSSPVETKFLSSKQLAEKTGESRAQIYRYVRLTELRPEILQMVDEGELGMRTAVELSYLGDLQKAVAQCMDIEQCTPTHAQSIRMRRLHEKGKLTPRGVQDIMVEAKPNQVERIILKSERFKGLFPKNLPESKREDYVADALEHYKRYLQRKGRGQER